VKVFSATLEAYLKYRPTAQTIRDKIIEEMQTGTQTDYTYREMGRAIHEYPGPIGSRFHELMRVGLVERSRVRVCRVTGFKAQAWRLR